MCVCEKASFGVCVRVWTRVLCASLNVRVVSAELLDPGQPSKPFYRVVCQSPERRHTIKVGFSRTKKQEHSTTQSKQK